MTDFNESGRDTIGEDELQSYVDGFLEPGRRAAVEAYLAANPGMADRVVAWRAQNIGLHRLFDPGADAEAGDEIDDARDALADTLARRRRVCQRAAIAASIAAMLAVGAAGWWVYDRIDGNRQLADAGRTLIGEGARLSERLMQGGGRLPLSATSLHEGLGDQHHPVPDLQDFGLALVGGGLLSTDDGPVVEFVYRGEGSNQVAFYVGAREPEPGEPNAGESEALVSLYWRRKNFRYGLVGTLPRAQLMQIAQIVSADALPTEPPIPVAKAPLEEEGPVMPAVVAPAEDVAKADAAPLPEQAPEVVEQPPPEVIQEVKEDPGEPEAL